MDIVGGQSIVADQLIKHLRLDESLVVSFIPHNPRLPRPFGWLQRIKYVRTIVTSVAYVASLLRQLLDQDVIHVFSASYWSFILAPGPAVLIGHAYGKRVLLNYHSGEAFDHLNNWQRSTKAVLARASAIIVPSQYLVDVFQRFGFRAGAIPNFVSVDQIPYRARSELRPVFLANRNFASHYNVGCVLRAFALIQGAVPEARLIVAGDGEQRAELHALAAYLGLRAVEFVGQVSPGSMAGLYDRADVYLNASNVDNMPMSIIEAFAAGMPIVTTCAGGIPNIVSHGLNGLMVDLNDHSAMAGAALQLLGSPRLVDEITQRARREVLDRYTWAAVHCLWRRMYGAEEGTHALRRHS
jgi:glycosyltransferase involved in cell wall biosynthesis